MTGFDKPLVENVNPVPKATGTQVLVRVKGAGICHSDLHIQDGYYDLGSGEKMSFEGRIQFPFTPGHETTGDVAALGPEAEGIEVGINVVICSWVGCGECAHCKQGDEHLCSAPQFIGVNKPGGYSDYVVVPHPRYLIDLGNLDPIKAAPMSCSGLTTYSAIRKFGKILNNVPLVIFGAGGLGLMATGLMAKLDLAPPVVVEIDAAKREAALKAGAAVAIDPNAGDAMQKIRDAVGQPVLAILDLVGSSDTAKLGLALIEKGGRMVIVGLLGGDIRISVPSLPLKSITLQGSYIGSPAELRELVGLLREKGLPDTPLDRRPLDQADAALSDLRAGKVVGRVVLIP
jgi:D-arabinose 1-dehydrogenase-like Zn-dependent alcohol dehydrogenase